MHPIEKQVDRRGRADRPARRRQVRRRRLRGLRRPARRRHLGGQRAVQPARRRGRAGRATSGAQTLPRRRARWRRSSKGEATDETGTTITFWPDADIFETVEFDYETLRTRFQQMAFLNKGLRITLTDERRGRRRGETTTASRAHRRLPLRRGLVDYVEYLNSAKKAEVVHDEVIAFEPRTPSARSSLEVAMQWTTAYSESVHTYANTINTHEGGTHEEGFRAALTTLVNRYAREKGILKEKDENLTGDDIREGLTAVISVKLGRAAVRGPDQDQARQHRGQGVRAAGRQRPARRLVRAQPEPGPRHHPQGDPGRRRPHGRPQGARARPGARACSSAAACPASSATARARTRRICEIFIVEGDSAGGSAVQRPRPGDPGDPAAARQDPQRREGAARPRARQRRGPGDDHRVRHRHRRGLRHREGRGTTRSC